VPIRNQKLDPRLPTPGDSEHNWLGFIPNRGMPHVLNPKSGVISNWNNKPVTWWPNWDTPVWGTHFRVTALRRALPQGQMGAKDLEKAIWTIARQEEGSWTSFMPLIRRAIKPGDYEGTERLAAGWLLSFDGWTTQGSKSALIYNAVISELKQQLFVPHTGNFVSAANLNLIVQTSPLHKALIGRAKFDYRAVSSTEEIIVRAFKKAVGSLSARDTNPLQWGFNPGGFRAPDGTVVPYANRGTYIQVLALDDRGWNGHSVADPGVSEFGTHSADQIPLARDWRFKPIWRP
jgi:penicillin amidase